MGDCTAYQTMKLANHIWKPFWCPNMKIFTSIFLYAWQIYEKYQHRKCQCGMAITYTTLGGGRLYSLPNNEACKPHLEAFLMSKHENFYINLLVCLTNLWKTPTQKMPMRNGPNLYDIMWWETVQTTKQCSLQTTFGSLSNGQTCKFFTSLILYAWGIYEKHQHRKCHCRTDTHEVVEL